MSGPACADCNVHQDMVEQVTLNKASCASAHHRIDELKKHTESIIRLSMSVEHLTEVIAENILPAQNDHNNRINNIENRPGNIALKWWRFLLGAIITASVTGVLGYILGQAV